MNKHEILTLLDNELAMYTESRDRAGKLAVSSVGAKAAYDRLVGCCSGIQGIITQINNAGA